MKLLAPSATNLELSLNKSLLRYKVLASTVKTSYAWYMKRSHGFTIIELVVVIVILGILLTLVVANLTSGQVGVRDAERKVDITNIATHLETFYTSGTSGITPGGYPGVDQLSSEANWLVALRDLDPANLRAPGYVSGPISLVPATNNVTTTAGVLPQPTNTSYVYQPMLN